MMVFLGRLDLGLGKARCPFPAPLVLRPCLSDTLTKPSAKMAGLLQFMTDLRNNKRKRDLLF